MIDRCRLQSFGTGRGGDSEGRRLAPDNVAKRDLVLPKSFLNQDSSEEESQHAIFKRGSPVKSPLGPMPSSMLGKNPASFDQYSPSQNRPRVNVTPFSLPAITLCDPPTFLTSPPSPDMGFKFLSFQPLCESASLIICPMLRSPSNPNIQGIEPACYSRNIEIGGTLLFQPCMSL